MSTTPYSLVSLRVGPSVTLEHVMLEWGRTDGSQGSQKVEDCQSTHHRPFSSLLLVSCVCCSIPTKSPNCGRSAGATCLQCRGLNATSYQMDGWLCDAHGPDKPSPTHQIIFAPPRSPTHPSPPSSRAWTKNTGTHATGEIRSIFLYLNMSCILPKHRFLKTKPLLEAFLLDLFLQYHNSLMNIQS